MSTNLKKDSLHDDDECGGDHHVDIRDMVRVDGDHEGEAHGSSETAVGHDEHLLLGDRMDAAATPVDGDTEEVGDDEPDAEDKEDGEQDEADIPDMLIAEPRDAKIEEDDTVAGGAEHLDEVVAGHPALLGDVLEGVMSLSGTS